jgi:hypothetical protein
MLLWHRLTFITTEVKRSKTVTFAYHAEHEILAKAAVTFASFRLIYGGVEQNEINGVKTISMLVLLPVARLLAVYVSVLLLQPIFCLFAACPLVSAAR